MFAPRKALWCARRRRAFPHWHADSPKGCRGRAESPLLFCRNIYTRGFFRQLRPEGDWGRAESPQCARRRIPLPCPRRGLTRRLRRGSRACSPMGRSHFSFGGERKVCKRKPAARRLREKALYCPFWRRGSLCRAQHSWPDYACYRARSELAFFRRQNGRAFFPPLPIAALLPRSWRGACLPLAG